MDPPYSFEADTSNETPRDRPCSSHPALHQDQKELLPGRINIFLPWKTPRMWYAPQGSLLWVAPLPTWAQLGFQRWRMFW